MQMGTMKGPTKTASRTPETSIQRLHRSTFVFLLPKPLAVRLSEVGLFCRDDSNSDNLNPKKSKVKQRYYSPLSSTPSHATHKVPREDLDAREPEPDSDSTGTGGEIFVGKVHVKLSS